MAILDIYIYIVRVFPFVQVAEEIRMIGNQSPHTNSTLGVVSDLTCLPATCLISVIRQQPQNGGVPNQVFW